MEAVLRHRLATHRQAGLMRPTRILQRAQHAHTQLEQQGLRNFSSNDYLGLASHPKLIRCLQESSTQWGVGAGASHLVSGHFQPHHELEQAIAAFTGRSRALLFSNGYMANLAVLSSLLGKGDTVLHDRLNHASLLDGGVLAGARFFRYRHLDLDHLQQRLQRATGHCVIASDGVFSMDGDVAPVLALSALARHANAYLMIDDAHGFGILGARGAGLLEHVGATQEHVPILMGTFGKALGTAGAFVAGSDTLIEYLRQFARPYIYTTALPPALAAVTLESINLLEQESWRRRHLQHLIAYFQHEARRLALNVLPSQTAIQAVILGENTRTVQAAQQLLQKGFLVGAIRPPTVPKSSARLRITLSASHQLEDVQALLAALRQIA